ncbi:MAG: hypothetical protein A2268_16035 [Candidatus Raymondbacteria bacterium RifOxyA12_full_50_37]|nr:MAG: hypothetical protein A2268_16035 [Candidatus Raymondbacteria bacterium RifOxyA12_full_50_37]OGJ92443.1 MAG: hypothetical protein A2248_11575 [Candidatus Raymondbacteria bacterium RIFOXYA2_FULL_49_16]OGJ94492.1 MAG: hypothetical protein A2350_07845 [Candidatus Raymondbacteria bacterium RifOxyB12_full_50_8]OGJ95252.1 MAG: hypothetical protein A2453_05655 [Candidatus Raymondbacteria bacterium RIFOXYC2_FULL_50_21]OGP39494.1 MAG: hypothetical protein A2324_11335 [Candidatus Raymondbacteria b
MRAGFLTAVGVFLIYAAFLPPGNFSTDGNSMLAVAESILRHGDVTVPPLLGVPGPDGRFYSRWYPLLSFTGLPFAAAGMALAALLHLPSHYLAAAGMLVWSALLSGLTAWGIVALARLMGATPAGACLAALSYAFGTVSLVYGRTLFAEPLLSTLFVWMLVLAFGPVTSARTTMTGLLCCAAVLAKPAGVIAGSILAAYFFLQKKPRGAWFSPALGTALGLCLYMLYNYVRFGSIATVGQPWSFSPASIPIGIAGLLISPGRGLVWYGPIVLFACMGLTVGLAAKKREAIVVALISACFLLLHSAWFFWHGGWSWGPRLLLPALALACAALGLLSQRFGRWIIVFTLAGCVINAPTLFSFYQVYYAKATQQGVSERTLLWSPAYAPLVRAWPAAMQQVRDARNTDVRSLVKNAGKETGEEEMQKVVALWWWMLPAVGIPRAVGMAVSLLLVLIGFLIIRKAMLSPARSTAAPPRQWAPPQ